MDIFSQLIANIRVSSPLLSELKLGRDTGCTIDPLAGSPFHYVVEGSAALLRDGAMLPLGAGDFVLMPQWTIYEVRSGNGTHSVSLKDETARLGLIPWSPELAGPLTIAVGAAPHEVRLLSGIAVLDPATLAALGRALPAVIHLPGAADQLKLWTDAAMGLVREGEARALPGFNAIAARAVEMLVSVALCDWAARFEHGVGWLRAIRDERLARVLDAIHREPGRGWTLAELASRAGLSRSALAAHFLAELGETPFDYLRRWRMHLARERLAAGREPIARIAADLGYGGALSFSRAFRQATGLTPPQWRRRDATP